MNVADVDLGKSNPVIDLDVAEAHIGLTLQSSTAVSLRDCAALSCHGVVTKVQDLRGS